jgi:hypothetical protein
MDERGASSGARALVRTTEGDRYFDYCLQPYDPASSPTGKLGSESLLWNSLDVAGAPRELDEALRAVQAATGRGMTVFGVKHLGGRIWWALYFYDPRKEDAGVRASAVIEAVRPWFEVHPRPSESVPYFMFSLDLTSETLRHRTVDVLNLYLPCYVVQGGRSYKLTRAGAELDNVYRFHHPKAEIREIIHQVKQSVFVDFGRVPLARVLLPQLLSCNRICVAKKRTADALYFSGLLVDQLLFFLERFAYPAPVLSFVRDHRSELDHLRFDVGFDYVMEPDGALTMTKSSYYGTL